MDATGVPVRLGSEFTVMTDTSDEDDDNFGIDESKRKLLGSVASDAIPKTVPVPVQMSTRSGKKPKGILKKKVRAM